MNFALDEEQERLRATARAFLAECSSSPQVRAAMDTPLGWDPAVWRRIAAELGDACNLVGTDPDVLRHKIEVLRRHCADVGRDPDEVAVTVLDLPVVGRDRDDVWARVERHRGRSAAAAYAARTHAGTVADHRERHAALAGLGVGTVFLATPDLDGPQDVLDLAALTA